MFSSCSLLYRLGEGSKRLDPLRGKPTIKYPMRELDRIHRGPHICSQPGRMAPTKRGNDTKIWFTLHAEVLRSFMNQKAFNSLAQGFKDQTLVAVVEGFLCALLL